MKTLRWFAACALLSACYTPRGAFVPVEEWTQSGTEPYVIAPGDTLQVRIFQQEAMSARVKVRPDGRVTLPLLNDYPAAGMTPADLAVQLQARLKEFINNPVVTVSLEESRPLTVSLVGEVMRPGTLTLEPGAGLLQALAAAGGLTEFAHREGIFVLRQRPGAPAPRRIRFTWPALAQAESAASSFVMVHGDVVVVE